MLTSVKGHDNTEIIMLFSFTFECDAFQTSILTSEVYELFTPTTP